MASGSVAAIGLTAIICLIAAAAALVGARGSRWSRIGWWMVGVFAVATALDSTVWNMVCAPSSNAACAAREASGAVPIGHQLHLLSSSIAVVASILSMIAFVVADSVEPTPASVRRVGRYMLAVVMTTQIWTGIDFAIDKGNASSGQVGLAEQAELIATTGWLIVCGPAHRVRTYWKHIGSACQDRHDGDRTAILTTGNTDPVGLFGNGLRRRPHCSACAGYHGQPSRLGLEPAAHCSDVPSAGSVEETSPAQHREPALVYRGT